MVLLGAVVALGAYYDANDERHWPYPTEEQLDADYDRYVGERALLFGTVERIDDDAGTATITVEHSTGSFELVVRGVEADVRPAGVIQVYGTLEPDGRVTAERVVVVNPAGASKLYKYAVSTVGALLVLALFFQYWRIDRATLSFEGR